MPALGTAPNIFCALGNLGLVPYSSVAQLQNDASNNTLNPGIPGWYSAAGNIWSYNFPFLTMDPAVDVVTGSGASGTASFSFALPAKSVVLGIVFNNTTANAVTGGIAVGTAANGTQVLTAQAVGANAFTYVPAASLTISSFAAATTLYFSAVTSWNNASVNFNIVYFVAA